MAENRLLDTNILVYAYDVSEKRRRGIAKALVDEVWDAGGGVVTLQNLSEFFFAVTRKVQKPVPIVDAKTIVSDILRSSRWVVIDCNAGTVMKAMDIVVETTRGPFWEALIGACMLEHGIKVIVTENEEDFKNIPGITVVNPFQTRAAGSQHERENKGRSDFRYEDESGIFSFGFVEAPDARIACEEDLSDNDSGMSVPAQGCRVSKRVGLNRGR